ncbi:hypothetical protein EX30DRAFT_337192 [Ascodesmis nigricans]|uniref:SWR1-complex protein 4 n=1 Tax=Ascodesmis nigricans TaxID=341454 RepID=A0A4S2N6I8_9PEZI|nr:hypothetical protein EX30DRAFT_337192 [Ascodesmis nigricans]
MSGFQDVRDVMDITGAPDVTARPPPPKKQKTIEKRPDGITRELYALLGENPPPVAIVETKFKERPKWMGKANPWIWKGFENPARSDGLTLYHWERKTEAMDEDLSYRFSKFNVQVDVPTYSDAEYETLKNDDWSREETDYLMNVCREYDLRFPVIWDRYEFPDGKPRSVEDIKARYYSVCRSLMELRTPQNQMSADEIVMFNLLNFDKEREVARKQMAARQFARTPEQCREEEFLLAELKRIVANQDKMAEERKDLFQRLSYPAVSGNGSISAYTGSQGLAQLRDLMVQNSDKNKRKRSAMVQNSADIGAAGAGTAANTPGGGSNANGGAQRDTQAVKKQVRRLSEEEELVFGVSMPEKPTTGVKLRSTMIAPSVKGASAQKMATAYTQLDIAPRLTMPTIKTVKRFEELQTSVGALLDAKKVLEKLEQEARVLKAQLEAKGISV